MTLLNTYPSQLVQIDQRKATLDRYRPLPAAVATQLREYFRVGLTYTSNALEGNTLTESETKVVLEDGLTIAGRPLRDHLEVTGHGAAYDAMMALAEQSALTETQLCELHRLFYHQIDLAQAGVYRTIPVIITGTTYIPPAPAAVPQRMADFVAALSAQRAALHPVEFAAYVHLELAHIHPFVDGNGRVARLAMNLALLQAGYPPAVIPPAVRADYIAALVCANNGDTRPFMQLISCMAYETMKDYLRMLQQLMPQIVVT